MQHSQCDECDKCAEYLAVILDYEDELNELKDELDRSKRYGLTLKEHLKKSSESTRLAKTQICQLEQQIDKLEYTIRHLRIDPDTMTNAELKEARIQNLQTIDELRRLVNNYQTYARNKERSSMTCNQLRTRNRNLIEAIQMLKADRCSAQSKVNKLVKSLEYKQLALLKSQDEIRALERAKVKVIKQLVKVNATQEGGTCVICLTSPAIYAHNVCGCLAYCDSCYTQYRYYTGINSMYTSSLISCSLCRASNTSFIKVHNLPSVEIKETVESVTVVP